MNNIFKTAFSLALVVACSSSDSSTSGTGTYSSGLPSGKKLSEVTQAEAQAACTSASTRPSPLTAEESKRVGCSFSASFSVMGAATDAEAQSKCQSAFDTCLAAPSEGVKAEDCTKAPLPASWAKCSATVAEFDACTNEQLVAFKALATTFKCSDAKKPTSGSTTTAGASKSGPACSAYDTKCPPG